MDLSTGRRIGAYRLPYCPPGFPEISTLRTRGCTQEQGGCRETTICYDPHCALPPCDAQPIQNALTFGVSPCERKTEGVPLHASEPCMSACNASCGVDVCAESCCTMPYHSEAARECISICDGYMDPSWQCAQVYRGPTTDVLHSFPSLPTQTCCTEGCTDMVACPTVAPGCTSMVSQNTPPMQPCVTPSEEMSSSSRSMSTASSTPMQCVWNDSSSRVPNIFPCRWDECDVQTSTLEALAAHVQQTHAEQAKNWKAVLDAQPTPMLQGPWEWPMTNGEGLACSPVSDAKPMPSTGDLGSMSGMGYQGDVETLLQLGTSCLCPSPLPGKKKHACGWENCDESFSTHAELTEHIANDHVGSGKNQYECRWVGCKRAEERRTFTQRQKVLRHIQSHTGDRPYVCRVCSKRFSEPTTLTQHMRIHTQERPYKCDYPGCDKSFSVAGSLTIHRRTHTGDRPFVCPEPGCGKQFAESSNLNKHMRVHRGDRPFHCVECGKSFARLDQLGRHRRAHEARRAKAAAMETAAAEARVARPAAT